MKIPVKVESACRLLARLAGPRPSGQWVQIDELAARERVPANYLVQILGDLRAGGLVASRRGKLGGYALARPADSITLLDVVELLDGTALELPRPGSGTTGARVRAAWDGVRRELEASLGRVTIADLADPPEAPSWDI